MARTRKSLHKVRKTAAGEKLSLHLLLVVSGNESARAHGEGSRKLSVFVHWLIWVDFDLFVVRGLVNVGLAVQNGDELGRERVDGEGGTKRVLIADQEKIATLAQSLQPNGRLGRTQVGLESLEAVREPRHHSTKAASEKGSGCCFVEESVIGETSKALIRVSAPRKAHTFLIVFVVVGMVVRVVHVLVLIVVVFIKQAGRTMRLCGLAPM